MNNKLKEIRKTYGYTQKEVAQMLGMKCEDRLSRWEKGTALPNIYNLLKICKIYGVKVEQVYED